MVLTVNYTLQRVLEQLPEGIIVVEANDEIAFVNQAAEEIRNISASEVVGRSVLACHPARSQKAVERGLQYLRGMESKTFTRMVTDHTKGRFYENTYTPIRDSESNYIGAVIVGRDITDRKKLEEERASHMQELEEKVAEVTGKFQDLFVSSIISLTTALEAKDPYTQGHSLKVCEMAVKVAEHVWGTSKEAKEVEIAAQLHDIGKVGVSEVVLHKPTGLTEAEFDRIKEHTVIGEKILAPIDRLRPVAKIVKHHHERFDGRGYPGGLKGDEIPEGSRILAVTDAFDAMTSARPYRSSITPEQAAEEIKKNLGTQFCPRFGPLFLDLFYTGSIS